jgi:Na+/melibiose symporter-like transporter
VSTTAAAPHTPPLRLSTAQIIRISALWFGLQFFWVSQQLVVMPERVRHFVPHDEVGTYLGLIKSFGALVVLATQLSIGFISDHSHSRLGRRRPFILYGMLYGLLAVAFFMLAPGYWWLFAAYMLIEATINAASVPFQALLPDLVPESQHSQAGAQMGLNHLGGNLVGLLVVIAMPILFGKDTILLFGDAKPAGYLYLLLPAYFIVLLATTLVVYYGVDELRWAQGAREALSHGFRELRLLPGVIVRYAETAPSLFGAIVANYTRLDLRGNPNFSWLALSRFAVNLGYHTFLTFVNYYTIANLDRHGFLLSLGFPENKVESYEGMVLPMMLICFILGGLLGNIISAPLSKRYGKKAVIATGLVSAGILFVPLIFTHSVIPAVGLGLLLGVGWGAFIAADWAFACTLMPKQLAGTYMGVWDATTLLPQVVAPIIGGFLRDGIVKGYEAQRGALGAEALAYQWVFATVVLYFALGFVLLRPVREARPQVAAAD